MTFREQLEELNACQESLEWVGNKSLKEAWETCENFTWMLWFLSKSDLDLIDPICDMVEEVLDLVPEDIQLACIWAISAAKRRANQDELNAAVYAVTAIPACVDVFNDDYASYSRAATAAHYAAYITISPAAYFEEMEKKQCDILRKYCTIDQVREAFNKLVA